MYDITCIYIRVFLNDIYDKADIQISIKNQRKDSLPDFEKWSESNLFVSKISNFFPTFRTLTFFCQKFTK